MIKESEALVITTGAGMGVDSGLPDFSGDGGLIEQLQKREKILKYWQIISHNYFDDHPDKFWYLYGDRYMKY